MIYKASLDIFTKFTTALSIIFLIFIIYKLSPQIKEDDSLFSIIVISIIACAYLLIFLSRPIHYILEADKIQVRRLIGNVVITSTEIVNVQVLNNEDLKWTFRVFAIGGIFGYWGIFTNSKLGSMRWYTTRKINVVLITTTSNKRIVISPDENDNFVAHFNQIHKSIL